MNKIFTYIIIITALIGQNIINAQEKNKDFTFPKDSLYFNYHLYKVKSIMKNCNWYNEREIDTDPKNISCLNIANNSKLNFFLSNIKDFNHIKALSIYNIQIKDFEFLNKLSNLEYISIGVITQKNIKSFVENLNNNKKIRVLEIYGLKSRQFPNILNHLRFIKSLEIKNSKLKCIDINLSLNVLEISNNKKIKNIRTNNVDYVILSSNGLKKMPEGLSVSKNLKGLRISEREKITFNCPTQGFEKLEILDFYGMPSGTYLNNININCFENKENIRIFYPTGSSKTQKHE